VVPLLDGSPGLALSLMSLNSVRDMARI
jgi:hypothetical protein